MAADHFRHRQILANIVPGDVAWGGYDQSFLTYREGKVLTVVFVARLMRVKYWTKEGGPERCQQVKFRCFRLADTANARALVYGKASPAQGTRHWIKCYMLKLTVIL